MEQVELKNGTGGTQEWNRLVLVYDILVTKIHKIFLEFIKLGK